MVAGMRLLSVIPPRGWARLLVAGAIAVGLSVALTRWASEPPFRALPAQVAVTLPETTQLLDRHGIRWRLEDRGQLLAVEGGRLDDALDLLAPRVARRAHDPRDPEARRLTRELTQLLAETLGRGKGFVAVDVVLDRDVRRTTRLRYDRRVVRQQEAGASERAAWNGPWSRGRWSRRSARVLNGAGARLVSAGHAPGGRREVSAAIVLDRSVARADARAFRSAVAAWLGPGPGRRVSVSRIEIAEPAGRARPSAWLESSGVRRWLPWTALLLASAVFLAQIRVVLRRTRDDAGQPSWLARDGEGASSRTSA